jgi:hypothetical protein
MYLVQALGVIAWVLEAFTGSGPGLGFILSVGCRWLLGWRVQWMLQQESGGWDTGLRVAIK